MRRWILILTAVLALSCLSGTASAHTVPEEGRRGSITVTMRYGDRPVSGGALTLYRVGAVQENDGNYRFVPTGSFTGWGADFGSLDSAQHLAQTAESLASYAAGQGLTGTTRTVGKNGAVTFSNLKQGLYLLVPSRAAKGFRKGSPFLVSVPYYQDGVYVYQVDASVKTELEREPTPTLPPADSDGKLPQTGQLYWPAAVLAALGLIVVIAGICRRRK
ncbi:MAG: hypothetical protein SOW84_01935 [Candidatus Faecousia sp.]|nr:hypothetical protein [Candidatus Faecousia sp.]